jgi:hypothetical protein
LPLPPPVLGAPSILYSLVPVRLPLTTIDEVLALSNGRVMPPLARFNTPGLSSTSMSGLPSLSGSSVILRESTVWLIEASEISSSPLSPVTLTLLEIEPTSRRTFTAALSSTCTTILFSTKRLKPSFSTDTVYVPGIRNGRI